MEIIALLLAALGVSTATADLIELSYTYNDDAPTSPKLTQFTHKIVKKGLNKFGIWVELNEFCASEHSGTHVDAPIHFAEHGWPLEAIPTRRLWRVPAVVIDVSKQIRLSGQLNYEVKVKDLEDWEKVNGVIPDGHLVLIRTGWGAKVNNIREYSGLDQHNKNNFPGERVLSSYRMLLQNLTNVCFIEDPRCRIVPPGVDQRCYNNFPGLGKSAAEWLAKHGGKHGHQTGVIGLGIDTISVDVGQSVRYPAHVALYTKNIYGIENMANLDKLPVKGAIVTVLPMRIGGGSGAPARIIAEVDEAYQINSAPRSVGIQTPSLLLVTLMTTVFARGMLLA